MAVSVTYDKTDDDIYAVKSEIDNNEVLLTLESSRRNLIGDSTMAKQAALKSAIKLNLPVREPGVQLISPAYPVDKDGNVTTDSASIVAFRRDLRLVSSL